MAHLVGSPYVMAVAVIADLVLLVLSPDITESDDEVEAEVTTDRQRVATGDTSTPVDLRLLALTAEEEVIAIKRHIRTDMQSLPYGTIRFLCPIIQ